MIDEALFAHAQLNFEDSKHFLYADALCPYLQPTTLCKVLDLLHVDPLGKKQWDTLTIESARKGYTDTSLYAQNRRLTSEIRHRICVEGCHDQSVVDAVCNILNGDAQGSSAFISQWCFLHLYGVAIPKAVVDANDFEKLQSSIIEYYIKEIDFDLNWLDNLDESEKAQVCELALSVLLNDTKPWNGSERVLSYLEDHDVDGTDAFYLYYGVIRILKGVPWRCSLFNRMNDFFNPLLDGLEAFFEGEFEKAYALMKEPVVAWSKSRNIRKSVFFPDFFGLLFYVCRLRAKIALDRFYADCSYVVHTIGGLKELVGYSCIEALYEYQYTADFHDPYYNRSLPTENLSVFSRILYYLVKVPGKNVDWIEECRNVRDLYRDTIPVLFNCFNDILVYVGDKDTPSLPTRKYAPWTSMIQGLEKWEIQLESIKQLFGEEQTPAKGEKQRRLVWLLGLSPLYAEPYVQVRSANGKWSSGQKFATKRLIEKDLTWLTPQDREMSAAYEVQRTYYYGRSDVVFNASIGFSILVDHPLLFSRDDRTPIRLEKRSVGLSIKEEDGACLLKLSAKPIEDTNISIEIVEPGHWVLYTFDTTLQSFSSILGEKGMSLPTDKLPYILGLVSRAKNLNINMKTKAAHVKADTTPLVQLWQDGSQYLASIRIRPAGGASGTTCLPAQGNQEVLQVTNGNTVVYDRDFAKEGEHVQDLLRACPTLTDVDDKWDWVSDDLTDFYTLITELQDAYTESNLCRFEWPKGERFKLVGKLQSSQITIHTKKSGNWFNISGDVQINEGQVLALTEILKNSNGKNPFVQLKDNEFIALTDDVRRSLDRLRLICTKGKGKNLVVHPLAGGVVEDVFKDIQHDTDVDWTNMIKRMKTAFELKPEIPPTLQAELRPYQVSGYVWLCRLAEWGVGACLADDMGLGKTIQSIAVMLREAPNGPCLLIAPTSVCPNWEEEIHRFAPSLQVVRLRDAIDRKEMIDSTNAGMVLIVGYGLLPRVQDLLSDKEWRMVVFDEAQALKNSTTQRSRAAHALTSHFFVALTGTPIENHLEDLWSVFDIINPGLLGSLQDFHRRFSNASEGGSSAAALKMLIRPFILRRLKSQVLDDLPELTEQTIIIEPTEKEAAFYESIRRLAVERMSSTDAMAKGQRKFFILKELTKLRRACCHASLADPQAAELVEPVSSKITRFLEILNEARSGGHKCLVFSQFTGHLALVRAELDKQNIPYQYLDGSTPEEKRRLSVAAFQSGKGDCFLISLKAGGQGLNLTAADIVIHLDPWWNPAVEDQATDRAHRIGQKNTVTVYRLVMAHSVEEKILRLHARKRDLAADFLEGNEEAVTAATLSEEELLSLLQ